METLFICIICVSLRKTKQKKKTMWCSAHYHKILLQFHLLPFVFIFWFGLTCSVGFENFRYSHFCCCCSVYKKLLSLCYSLSMLMVNDGKICDVLSPHARIQCLSEQCLLFPTELSKPAGFSISINTCNIHPNKVICLTVFEFVFEIFFVWPTHNLTL